MPSMFQKRHYKAIAKIVASVVPSYDDYTKDEYDAVLMLTSKIASLFQDDNPSFNRQRFMDACNLGDDSETIQQEEDEDADITGF